MALMFVDSFDMTPASPNPFANTDMYRKWLNNTAIMFATGGRRNGGYISTGYTNRMLYGFNGIDEFIFGCAIKQHPGGLGTFAANSQFMSFGYDEDHYIGLSTTDSGAIVVARSTWSANGTQLTSSVGAPPTGQIIRSRDGLFHSGDWYHMELRYKIGASGEIEIRVNEETVGSFSGDTRFQAVAGTVTKPNVVNWMGLGSFIANTAAMNFDDVYLCNAQGSTNNTFLGDCRVDVVYPIANSTPIQLSAEPAGGDNYTKVDETRWDLTDYVYSATAGHQDIYVFGDVTSSSDIYYGIQINAVARKSDAGSRRMKILTKSGGVVYKSNDYYLNESAWIDHLQVREVNPATGTAWTDASINAAEFGVEVV